MKYYVKVIELGIMRKFFFYDKEENLLYTSKIEKSIHSRAYLKDAQENLLGQMEVNFASYISKMEVTNPDGSPMETVSFKTGFHPKYIMNKKGWYALGEYKKWKYALYDENDEQILKINRDDSKDQKYYGIDIKDGADVPFCMLMVIAINAMENIKKI